jgi:hypothetical protein
MSNFRYRLRESVQILATGEGDVKNRLMLAGTNHLIFANIPEDESIPQYFRTKLESILQTLTVKEWGENLKGDKIRATLHRMRFKTGSEIAFEIWNLYNEYEEFLKSDFIPFEKNS